MPEHEDCGRGAVCFAVGALQAVGNLEDELGVRLFERVGRGLVLNEAGRMFYRDVSRILLLLDDSVRGVRRLTEAKRCGVSVLFTAATFLAPHIRRNLSLGIQILALR